MRSHNEYSALLKMVMAKAQEMEAFLPPSLQEGITSFLSKFGCAGFPSGKVGGFWLGQWLARPGKPTRQHEAVAVVPCFSDDIAPIRSSTDYGRLSMGTCNSGDHAIVLFNVDHWSVPELALALLHEGRHARHKIGPKLASLAPLDLTEEVHETCTWIFMMNVLGCWGGALWGAAVQHEIDWFYQQGITSDHPGQVICAESKQYWPELDQLWGSSSHEHVRQVRRQQVVLTANMIYWAQRYPGVRCEDVCHGIVSHMYT